SLSVGAGPRYLAPSDPRSVQVRTNQLGPQLVSASIHVELILDKNVGTRLSVRAQHGWKDVDEIKLGITLDELSDQAVGFLDSLDLGPAGGIGRNRDVGDPRLSQFSRAHFADELLEIVEDLFWRFACVDVIPPGIHHDQARLIRPHDSLGERD